MFYLLCCSLIASAVGLKTWIPTTDMRSKVNWDIRDIPRDCDDVSFNVSSDISLFWPFGDLLVTGLTLPSSGSVVFENNILIRFSDRNSCPTARDICYVRDEWKGWLDPDNWESDSAEGWLPHAERIPCSGESVKFPQGKSFSVQLPKILVPIGKVFFDDEEYDGDDWTDFLNTARGRREFRGETSDQLPWSDEAGCSGRRKCSCWESAYVFKDRVYKNVPVSILHQAVCLYAMRTCKALDCFSPVTPQGHCCPVCGGVIKVEDKSQDDRLLKSIRDIVGRMSETDSDSDHVKVHVGRTQDEDIQIVVLAEASSYAGQALTFAALVQEKITEEKLGNVLTTKFSGLTLSNYVSNISGIVFGTLFAVIFFFISLYYIYIILPKKNFQKMTEYTAFKFARFQNASHETGSEEKLEIGGEEAMPDEESQGFQNPTFSTSSDGAGVSMTSEAQEQSEDKERSGREYDNPIYHEMEKTRELAFFEVKPDETISEDMKQFSEIEL